MMTAAGRRGYGTIQTLLHANWDVEAGSSGQDCEGGLVSYGLARRPASSHGSATRA